MNQALNLPACWTKRINEVTNKLYVDDATQLNTNETLAHLPLSLSVCSVRCCCLNVRKARYRLLHGDTATTTTKKRFVMRCQCKLLLLCRSRMFYVIFVRWIYLTVLGDLQITLDEFSAIFSMMNQRWKFTISNDNQQYFPPMGHQKCLIAKHLIYEALFILLIICV